MSWKSFDSVVQGTRGGSGRVIIPRAPLPVSPVNGRKHVVLFEIQMNARQTHIQTINACAHLQRKTRNQPLSNTRRCAQVFSTVYAVTNGQIVSSL